MTPEVSVARKALTVLVLAVALIAAVIVQLTVVNRLPLPGSAAPDLVLLLVTAIAVTAGPATAALAGFAGGLALDVAPPAAHYAGEYALVFCLVCYAAARVMQAIWNMTGERDQITAFTVMAVAAAAGEGGKAAIAMMLSDQDVTVAAVSRVLPAAVLYDLVLAPLVFWLVALATRGVAGTRAAERAPAPEFGPAGRLATVFRLASAGAAPDLRLAGTGANYRGLSPPRRVPDLRLAGTGANHGSQSPARRVPKLRLSGRDVTSSRRTMAASSASAPFPVAGGRAPKLNFAGDSPVRPAAGRGARTPGKNWLRTVSGRPLTGPSGLSGSSRGARTPGKNWLRTSAPAAARRPRRGPSRGWAGSAGAVPGATGIGGSGRPRTGDEVLAARSAPSGLSAAAFSGTSAPMYRRGVRGGAGRRGALRSAGRSPKAGWLSSSRSGSTQWSRAAARRAVPGRRWLRGANRPGGVARGNWYHASPSGAWLRRGRRSWRRRGYLPGGRPPGGRAMAKTAGVPRARKPRLFGILGGRR